MSRVEQVEKQVSELDASELRIFREWFARYDDEAWDRQLEADAQNGKLARLADRALRNHKAGRSTKL